jgi:hypothetical protein
MTVTPFIYSVWRTDMMSKLEDAMLAHMHNIIDNVGPVFWYKDFISFEVNGKKYGMKRGTFRNKISKFRKAGIVKVAFHTTFAAYTLSGVKLPRPVTPNHAGVNYRHHSKNLLYQMIENLPLKRQSIHDIRLVFKVPNIWKVCKQNPDLPMNERSKDIRIPHWTDGNALILTNIHRTDTVSVIIRCSSNPIPLDANGMIYFFNLLVRAEERLKKILDSDSDYYHSYYNTSIPSYKNWTVTMWHFGRDSLTDYSAERFSATVEEAQGILTRIYVKDIKNKKRVRLEVQEYPDKSLEEAIRERLFENIPLPIN